MTSERITSLLQDIQLVSEHNYEIMQSIRNIVLNTGAHITEEVKYGGILFSKEKSFCGAFSYKDHISVEFSNGAKLTDTFGLLEGKGKQRRHIKVNSLNELEEKKISHYVSAALAYSQHSEGKSS